MEFKLVNFDVQPWVQIMKFACVCVCVCAPRAGGGGGGGGGLVVSCLFITHTKTSFLLRDSIYNLIIGSMMMGRFIHV